MTATATRLRAVTQSYVIEQPTQHWRIVDGVHYRDTWVRTPDGARRLFAIRDAA